MDTRCIHLRSGYIRIHWSDTLVQLPYLPLVLQVQVYSFVREQPSLTALPRRSDAAHGTADKLVYCHEAMHVQQRMQGAGWSADVERWESDEDSDGSGDEGDCDVVGCSSSVRRPCGS